MKAIRDITFLLLHRTFLPVLFVGTVLRLTPPALAQDQSVFTINDGAVSLTKHACPGGAVTIPESIDGMLVTSIEDSAFEFCTNMTSVTIPNSMTFISAWAFFGCTALTNVTIPNSVTRIEESAFSGCSGLTSVTIPNSVRSIGQHAFSDCAGLANVTIPKSVTDIWERAFSGCTNLTNVTFSDGVRDIQSFAFLGCTGLTNVTIPKSVDGIGYAVFEGCTSLLAITVDPLNTTYSSLDGVLLDKSQTTLLEYPAGRGGSYTIPDTVTNIFSYAFLGCTGLTNVTIPSSVESIEDAVFEESTSLVAITVDPINPSYSSLDGVLFDKSQTMLIEYPTGKAGSYIIPKGVTNIGLLAFEGCTGLTSVTVPNSVATISGEAFEACTNLTAVYFQGDAPLFGTNAVPVYPFIPPSNVTVYYLPGTTSWKMTYGGRPTAIWLLPNPLILAEPPSFGVRASGFGFTVSWATNSSLIMEAATSLTNSIWSPVTTNTLVGGISYLSDPQWAKYPSRFYRVRAQ